MIVTATISWNAKVNGPSWGEWLRYFYLIFDLKTFISHLYKKMAQHTALRHHQYPARMEDVEENQTIILQMRV
jgi:hypothetical protein